MVRASQLHPIPSPWTRRLALVGTLLFTVACGEEEVVNGVPALGGGTHETSGLTIDVIVMFVAGAVGFFLRRSGYSVAGIVLGLILGKIGEQTFAQAMQMLHFEWSGFFGRPIAPLRAGLTNNLQSAPQPAGKVFVERIDAPLGFPGFLDRVILLDIDAVILVEFLALPRQCILAVVWFTPRPESHRYPS